jgi:filamentous hemagglutinin family protein
VRPKSWFCQGWQLALAGSLALVEAFTGGVNNSAFAQIIPDRTLGDERSIVKPYLPNFPDAPLDKIEGGAIRGANLFHSFEQFNVSEGRTAFFDIPRAEIQNILARVTGGKPSEILGTLGTSSDFISNSHPNLFLINPNGIIFGQKASLDVGGSFVATTANAIQFGNQGFFSASAPDVPPVLTVNPSALLFNQIGAGSIINQSVAPNLNDGSTVDGLRVPDGNSLLLVGGNVELQGGRLRAQGGRVELGGLPGAGTVELDNNLHLSFPDGVALADVSLSNAAKVTATGTGGQITVQGRHITLTEGSQIFVNGAGGDIEVQGRRVTLTEGSQIFANTTEPGRGGMLVVTASDAVELSGISGDGKFFSGLFTQALAAGDAGDLTIKTGKLIVQDGAQVSADTFSQGRGGKLSVNASDSIQLSGKSTLANGTPVPSGLFTQASDPYKTGNIGDAGDLRIQTGRLIVRNGAGVAVSRDVLDSGKAGNLEIAAQSIQLDNQGFLTAKTLSGKGGDIRLQVQDLLLLRHDSEISTTAGTAKAGGDGGNINIDTQFLVALPSENSDISADAYTGKGGNVQITAQDIFGTEFRPKDTSQSDITASSKFGIDGVVRINTPDIDPSRGLVALPTELVDASRLIAQNCSSGGSQVASTFTVTGRGGLPDNPSETLSSNAVWTDLRPNLNLAATSSSSPIAARGSHPTAAPLVEAQGWVINDKGEVVLTASAPTVTPHNPALTPAQCHVPKTS